MDCIYVILRLPLTKIERDRRVMEFRGVTLVLIEQRQVTDDVVKHELSEFRSALEYGAITLEVGEIGLFLSRIEKTDLRTLFTIYIRTSVENKDPHMWNLETYFHQIHYDGRETTIKRPEIVDADQALVQHYSHLRTKVGYLIYQSYLSMYLKFYNDQDWVNGRIQWDEKVKSDFRGPTDLRIESWERTGAVPRVDSTIRLSSVKRVERGEYPTAPKEMELKQLLSDEASGFEKRSQARVNILPNYDDAVVQYQPERGKSSLLIDSGDQGLASGRGFMGGRRTSGRMSTYQPVLLEKSERSGFDIWRYIFCRAPNVHDKMQGRIGLESYDSLLQRGIIEALKRPGSYTKEEILAKGGRVKNGVVKKTFYDEGEIEIDCKPLELCEFIAVHWDVELTPLMNLTYYLTRGGDAIVGDLIVQELSKILKEGKGRSRVVKGTFIIIGKLCKECQLNQFSDGGSVHYHSDFLDRLFQLRPLLFRRLLVLAFEKMNKPVNILTDKDFMEIQF